MKHESFETVLNVSDSDVTFEDIYQKPYVPTEHLEEIKRANLLIIPNEGFREEGDTLFPETTRELFEYLKENSSDGLVTDIAISDGDFRRIELHSAVIEIAQIIVQWVVLPVATSLLASFLYDLVKKYHRSPEDTSAKVQITVEETEAQKSKRITYEGPVSGIKDALDQATKELFSKE